MSVSFAFIILKDEFYEEYNIPKLPIPYKVEELGKSVEIGGMSFPQMVDNLMAFLEEEPAELDKYRVLLSTMSYYAGLGETSREQYEQAYKYLKISRKYGYIKNMSVIHGLGMICIQLGKIEEARDVFFFGYDVTKHHEFIPKVWIMLIICYYMLGDLENSFKLMEEFFSVARKIYPTSYEGLYQDLYNLAMLAPEDKQLFREIEKYHLPEYS